MLESIFWGAALRVAQAALQATPTILVGLMVAGVFSRLFGREGTRRLFGVGTRRELLQAWLIGMLLPVCSLGVIPVARQMRKAGIGGGTILAFAMTAPLFNPLSMLYGLTLSEPLVILSFAFGSMMVVTVVGGVWNRFFPAVDEGEPARPPVAYGLRRMTAILTDAARELVGPSAGYIAVGLLGVVALAAALPPGRLMATMEHDNPYAPLAMAAIAVPAYATPMVAMSQLGSMFQHANSVGAAFVLLTLGAGTNLGLLAWMFRSYGVARGGSFLALLLAVVLGLAYAAEEPLHPSAIQAPGHTHAFDIYCRPFPADTDDLPARVRQKLREDLQPYEVVGLAGVGAIAAFGLGLRLLDRRWRIETWLEAPAPAPEGPRRWHEAAVPAPVLGLVALAGMVAFSVVGCYAYYPPADEVFEEMSILKAEVLTAAISGDRKHAEHYIPIWMDWTRRLQVGVYLREWGLSPYKRMKAQIFRDRLEMLKHAIEDGEGDEAKRLSLAVDRAYRRMRAAYPPAPPTR